MAEESIIDRAIGFIPGVGKPKRAKRAATTRTQLATLQRNLARLAKDVEKLSRLIGGGQDKRGAKTATKHPVRQDQITRASSTRPVRRRSA